MDTFSFQELEFPAVKQLLAARTQTPHGRALAAALAPLLDREAILAEQRLTRDAVRYHREHQGFGLGGLEDLGPTLELLRIENTRLEPKQMLQIAQWIDTAQNLRLMVSDLVEAVPDLAAISRRIPDLRSLSRAVRQKILPGGEIDEGASEELQTIRRDAHRLRDRIQRRLQAVLRESPEAAIQDEIITVRNDRFVVPVSSSHRRDVPGVIHAMSGSGATVFIEPIETIESNNELIRLLELEQAEIARILFELTERLREELGRLEALIGLAAQFDLLGAKARLSIDFSSVEPSITEAGRLRLTDVRHLVLEENLRKQRVPVVPVSLELDAEHRTLIISGPNAGGKTVVLKTVGLCALMAQSGLQIPAREAELPVFEQVLAEIGDHQSIAANLSTFTAHVQGLSEILHGLCSHPLVLLDEAGTGTDPDEGAALAVAIVSFLHGHGAMTLVTTHYNALKSFAYLTPGVLNASVEFDERNLKPTFRLLPDVAGSSNGIEIARRMGLPGAILDQAEQIARQSDQEARRFLNRLKVELEQQTAARAALQEERAATAERYERLDRDFRQRQAAHERELDSRFDEVAAQFQARAEQMLGTIGEKGARGSVQKSTVRKIRDLAASSRHAYRPATSGASGPSIRLPSREIRAGDRVHIPDLGKSGTVERVDAEELTIAMGLIKWKARIGEVELVDTPPAPAVSLPSGVSVHARPRGRVRSELNLIGRTVEEALEEVDQFLDEAVLASLSEVRIIHGSGSGALRKAIRAMLEKHPHVGRFRPAEAHEGAGGATVVELRKTGE
ncbi:MAG: endonuclease MutS2 [Acidobacteria bacterium]|nr:endonuclease MutS2 [Acidobacteriota bacterium]